VENGVGLWVNAGFCGGLRPELGIGHIIIEEISAVSGQQLERFVAVDRVLATAEQKASVARQYPMALGADMESAVFAGFCQAHGLHGVVIRAVSDTLIQDFPLSEGILYNIERQRPRPVALAGYLVTHPGRIFPFLRFLRGLRVAQVELGRALCDYLDGPDGLVQH
jgi:uridine phosphorylase